MVSVALVVRELFRDCARVRNIPQSLVALPPLAAAAAAVDTNKQPTKQPHQDRHAGRAALVYHRYIRKYLPRVLIVCCGECVAVGLEGFQRVNRSIDLASLATLESESEREPRGVWIVDRGSSSVASRQVHERWIPTKPRHRYRALSKRRQRQQHRTTSSLRQRHSIISPKPTINNININNISTNYRWRSIACLPRYLT